MSIEDDLNVDTSNNGDFRAYQGESPMELNHEQSSIESVLTDERGTLGHVTVKSEWEEGIEAQLEQIKESQKNLDGRFESLDRDRVSLITILGVFVSIFTFISIEVQILKHLCDISQILGLSLILAGILILFIAMIDVIARSWLNNGNLKGSQMYAFIAISTIMIIAGGWLASSSSPKNCNQGSDRINITIDRGLSS